MGRFIKASVFAWVAMWAGAASAATVTIDIYAGEALLSSGVSGSVTYTDTSGPATCPFGSICSATFNDTDTVTLTAVPTAGTLFGAWYAQDAAIVPQGPCHLSTSLTCTFVASDLITQNTSSIGAVFVTDPYPLVAPTSTTNRDYIVSPGITSTTFVLFADDSLATFSVAQQPEVGSVVFDPVYPGKFTYTNSTGLYQNISFDFAVTSGSGVSALSTTYTATFTINDFDTDGDGIFDSGDQCPATRSGAAVNVSGCPLVNLTVNLVAQPSGEAIFDYGLIDMSPYGISCFEGVCQPFADYYEGQTATLSTYFVPERLLLSEWVNLTCDEGVNTGNTCTFAIPPADVDGNVVLQVDFIENPDYVNQAPSVSPLAIVAEAGVETVQTLFATDLENDPLTYSLGETTNVLGNLSVDSGGAVTFTPADATSTGRWETTVTVSDGRQSRIVPLLVIVNPLGAALPTGAVGSFISYSADSNGAASSQFPSLTAADSGAVTYSVYIIDTEVSLALTDVATGSFEFQANLGYTGDIGFIVEVTDSSGVSTAFPASVFVTQSKGPAGDSVCPSFAYPLETDVTGKSQCLLPNVVDQDLTLTSGITWVMYDPVIVGNGYKEIDLDGLVVDYGVTDTLQNVTLTIEAGTRILALNEKAALFITRGSSINAVGTSTSSIMFESADLGQDGQGEWLGVFIQGRGIHRSCADSTVACNTPSITGLGQVGGTISTDSSGALSYVVIAEAGSGFDSQEASMGALTLESVGSGTQIDHVQVVGSAGRGMRVIGGDVDMAYLKLDFTLGASMSFEQGYQGDIQYLWAELDQNADEPVLISDLDPVFRSPPPERFTSPLISNATLLVRGSAPSAIRIDGHGGLFLFNSAIGTDPNLDAASLPSYTQCISIDDNAGSFVGTSSLSTFYIDWDKTLLQCARPNATNYTSIYGTEAKTFSGSVTWSVSGNWRIPQLQGSSTGAITNTYSFDPNMTFTTSTLGTRAVNTAFLEPVNFVGAVDPALGQSWWSGWAVSGLPGDQDDDGVPDNVDAFINDPAASVDTDGDGLPDDWNPGYTAVDSTTGLVLDDDDDNDGIVDGLDAYPLDETNPEGNCPSWATTVSTGTCALPNQIIKDRYLTASVIWIINGQTRVGNGDLPIIDVNTVENNFEPEVWLKPTLTIEAGSHIEFANFGDTLLVTRGAKINAQGSDAAPIVFTGNGGNALVITGLAPTASCAGADGFCNNTPSAAGLYGGVDANDNSGILNYVTLEQLIDARSIGSPPMLALLGVGDATSIDHVIVDGAADRGVFIAGGTLHLSHLGVTGAYGDSLAWTDGFQGSMQFVVLDMGEQQQGDGIYAESGSGNGFATGLTDAQRSAPTIANLTIYNGSIDDWVSINLQDSGALVFDSVIMKGSVRPEEFESCVIGVEGDNLQGLGSWLVFDGILADCQGGAGTGYFTSVGNLSQSLDIVSAEAALDVRLASLSPRALLDTPQDWVARLSGLTYAADPARFTSVSYLGAVDPTAGMDPWWLFGATSDAPDADGDGITDAEDAFPNDATEFVDSDGDGIGDVADTDDDNDGVVDTADAFPYSPRFSVDADGDGIAALIDLNDADNTVGLASWLDVEVAVTDSVLASCLAPLAASGLQPADIQTLECGGSIGSLAGLNLLKALQGVRIVTGAPLDVSALEQLPALKGVDLSGNAIKDSTILSGLTQVNTLYLGGNHLRNIDGLSALTNLVRLDLAGNYIQKADALGSLTQLQELRLANNDLVDATGLASLAAMRNLDVSRNQLRNLDFVSGLSNLQAIDASNNPIESVAGFATSQSPYLANVDLANTLVPTLANYFDHFSTITCPSVVPTGLYCSTGVIEVANMSYLSCDELGALEGSSLTLGTNTFCQPDSDLDGYVDGLDDFITDPVAYRDTDNDGLPDEFFPGLTAIDSTSVPALMVDDDDDNDGVLDLEDAFPVNPFESADADGDGVGDNRDLVSDDAAVAYAYMPDVIDNVTDFALNQCVAQSVLGISPSVSDGFSEFSGITASETLLTEPDYGSAPRPRVYSDLITFLNCDSVSSAMNLSGVGMLTYLTELSLQSNGIADLNPLAGLKALADLNLFGNNITDVSALAGLTQMRSLTLWENAIEDVSSLADMVLLEYLDLDTNNISSVSSLNQLSNLNEVYLHSNQIESLAGVEGWTNLEFAWFSDNQLSDISAIQNLSYLQELDLANNLITDLPPLNGLASLSYLDVSNNQIRKGEAFVDIPQLTDLLIRGNFLTDISFANSLATLSFLDASDNPLGELGNVSDSSLYELRLKQSRLDEVDSGRLPASLGRLYLDNNHIQTMDVLLTHYLQDGGANLLVYASGNPLLCSQQDFLLNTSGITAISLPVTCQEDFDSDGVADIFDLYPSDPAAATDSDGDGMPDVLFTASAGLTEDTDDDNDGVADLLDAFPLDPTESVDTDGDGVGDNKDADPNDPAVQYFKISSALAAVTDPALSSCAAQQADKAQTTDLITRLYCADEITDLSGLAQFPYLQQVQLVTPTGSGVTDLSQLSVLPDLRNLGLSGDFADLSALGSLSKLETLDLLFTSVGDRDISALGSLSNLKTLYLQNAQVTDWSPLGSLTQLESLSLPGAGITDLSVLPLASLTSLKSLNLSLNGFTALTGVENLSMLTDLKIDQTAVTDLSALSATVGLQSLSMAGIPATDLSVLSDLSSLESLHMPDVAISSSSIFSTLSALRVLNIDRTGVVDLTGLSSLTNMGFLSVSGNNLDSLSGVENMTFLEGLVASDNALTTLDGAHALSSLVFLNVADNALTSIAGLVDSSTESAPYNLEFLIADNNLISDVSILGWLYQLRLVSLNNNAITSLSSLSSLYSLESLSARNNLISSVPALVNYDLAELGMGITLDLSGNPIDCSALDSYNAYDIRLTFDAASCVDFAGEYVAKAPLTSGLHKAAMTAGSASAPTLGFDRQVVGLRGSESVVRPLGANVDQRFTLQAVQNAFAVLPDLLEPAWRTMSYFATEWVEVVSETLNTLFEEEETAESDVAQKTLKISQINPEQNLLAHTVAMESVLTQRPADLSSEISIETLESAIAASVQWATRPPSDFVDKSSGGGAGYPVKNQYHWELFATSYGVLKTDADIIWMNSDPQELHVLRAVR